MRLLATWLVNALALLAIPYLISSVQIDSFGTALVVAVVLGLVNTIIRPIVLILTLPATVLSLGLFIFIINGLMFWGVANMVDGFHVTGFWAAVGGALLYSVISWALSTLLLQNKKDEDA
ncbi:phage holin family protein [Undibacterium sp. Ji42W]|uniref:phage holin family protein n=1 Tax=Undibacterium sp. Ji42W TaxID=3413039 RepID=UPI003BF3A876